jgi:methyl halide transferase
MAMTELNPDFWEEKYQTGSTRWDLAQPAPAFVHLLGSSDAPKPGRMAVLGTGRGHDALYFASQGFEVVGFDYAPSAIAAAKTTAKERRLTAQFLQRDIFDLSQEFADSFDYILEHTCFCAISPTQRPAYVQLVHALLHPQGELIALFWAHARSGGPPFGSTLEEICQLFATDFDIHSLAPVSDSPSGRENEEYLGRLQVKKLRSVQS